MPTLLSVCEAERTWLLEQLTALVACESPSTDQEPLDRCGALLASQLESTGASVERIPAATTADHVVATWPGAGPPVMLLGHFDTVWPVGQLARMPLREDHGHLYGPGVYDMKAGLVIGMLAARAVRAVVPASGQPRITLVATSDEEVGAGTSRELIERMAAQHEAVLVLEPALRDGGLKTSRKGVGEFTITARGVSSHAGADPALGASAVHELARQVIALESLRDPDRGVSVNVGVFQGGSRGNVVAEHAQVVVDVRVEHLEDAARLDTAFRALAPVDPRVELHVKGRIDRPPMERTGAVVGLFEIAREVASEIGDTLTEGATGGASDGNFTAAIGVPTLDGLGAVGDGAHALGEHVVIDQLPRRAAVLAGVLARLGSRSPNRLARPSDVRIG